MKVTVVTAPSGKHVSIIDLQDDEALPLPVYEQASRRLDLGEDFKAPLSANTTDSHDD